MSSIGSFYELRDKMKRRMIEEEEEDETFFRNAINNINDSEDETDYVSASVIAAAELLSRK